MGAIRTQIYLTEDLRDRIDAAIAESGETMAEFIRTAVEERLRSLDRLPYSEVLAQVGGMDPDFPVPDRLKHLYDDA